MNKKEFFIYLTGEALLPGGGGIIYDRRVQLVQLLELNSQMCPHIIRL